MKEMKNYLLQVLALFFLLFYFPFPVLSDIVFYVNINNGDDSNDGLSWNSAFKNLQPAIDAAVTGDTIKVAAGTYLPTEKMAMVYDENATTVLPTNDRHSSFLIKDAVCLLGGFPADATDATAMSDRDWIKNKTILSGDFNGDDDDNFANRDENALHVVVMLNATSATGLDGFYITGGNACNDAADVIIDDILVQRNCGSGIYAFSEDESSPTLTNLVIWDNQAENDGGGLYNYSIGMNASPQLKNVTVISNRAGRWGGGFYNDGMYAAPRLLNVNLSGNLTTYDGGGFFCVAEKEAAPSLENVLIAGNMAKTGGGALIWALEEDASPVLTNVTICGNKVSGAGSGLVVTTSIALTNLYIRNSVIWGNTADNLRIEGNRGEVVGPCNFIEGALINYSIWDDNSEPMFVDPIDANFAPTVSGDYRLLPESPLIDKGDNSFVTLSEDLDGQTRITGYAVDIGAYEYQGDNSGNEALSTNERIWSHQGNLYVKITGNDVTLRVYSLNGQLVRQINKLEEGFYTFPLPNGIYFITLSTGVTAKISL